MRSNCLIFSLWMWRTRGGYIAIRRSNYYWGWHFIWEKRYRDGRVVMLSLVPTGSDGKPAQKFKRWCPPLLFSGVLVRGDE